MGKWWLMLRHWLPFTSRDKHSDGLREGVKDEDNIFNWLIARIQLTVTEIVVNGEREGEDELNFQHTKFEISVRCPGRISGSET